MSSVLDSLKAVNAAVTAAVASAKQPKSSYQMNLYTPAQKQDDQWNTRRVLSGIANMYSTDPATATQKYNDLKTLQNDKSSKYYNPFLKPTNQFVDTLNDLGFDVSNINDDWFEANSYLQNYYITGTTNNPTKPGKNASPLENAAYAYYQVYQSNETTKKALTESNALKDELTYWATQSSRNYSDDEIINRINWDKYPTLTKMNESAYIGAPIELNAAVPMANNDWMQTVIWQARNDGGTGNMEQDMIMSYRQLGNVWQDNEDVRSRLDPQSDAYAPYTVGSTLDDAMVYYNRSSFDKAFLNENKPDGSDKTENKMYNLVKNAVDFTDAANAELEDANKWLDRWLESGTDPDAIMKKFDSRLDSDWKHLKQMDDSVTLAGSLIGTSDTINYSHKDVLRRVEEACEANRNKLNGPETLDKNGMNIGSTQLGEATKAGDQKIGAFRFLMDGNFTPAEEDQFKNAPSATTGTISGYLRNLTDTVNKYILTNMQPEISRNYVNSVTPLYGQVEANQKAQEELNRINDEWSALSARNETITNTGISSEEFLRLKEFTEQNNWTAISSRILHPDVPEDQFPGYQQQRYDEIMYLYRSVYPDAAFDYDIASKKAVELVEIANATKDIAPLSQEEINRFRDLSEYKMQQEKIVSETDAAVKELGIQQMMLEARISTCKDLGIDTHELEMARDVSRTMASFENYEASEWAYNMYDLMMQSEEGGASFETVKEAADAKNAEVQTELQSSLDLRDYITENNIEVPEKYMNNLNRHIEKLERYSDDYNYFTIQGESDFREMAEKGKEIEKDTVSREYRLDEEDENGYSLGQYMTEVEKDTYYYLLAKDGYQAAMEYYGHLGDLSYGVLGARQIEAYKEDARTMNPVLSNALAILAAPWEGIAGLLYLSDDTREHSPTNPLLSLGYFSQEVFSETINKIKDAVPEGIGQDLAVGAYEILYQRGRSMANMPFGVAIGGPLGEILTEIVGALPMALGAGAMAVADAKGRNATDEQAMLIGGVTILMESFTEGLTQSNIRGVFSAGKDAAKKTIGSMVKEWLLSSGLEEAFGETLTDYIENLVDKNVMGVNSNHYALVDRILEEMGADRNDPEALEAAEKQANEEEIAGLVHTAIISYLSPGMDVAISSVVDGINDFHNVRVATRNAQQNGENVSMADKWKEYKAYKRQALSGVQTVADARENATATPLVQEQARTEQATDEQTTTEQAQTEQAAVQQETLSEADAAFVRDLERFDVVADSDLSTQAAAVSAFLGGVQGTQSGDISNAAAVALPRIFGSMGNTIDSIKKIMTGAKAVGTDMGAVKQALQTAALSLSSEARNILTSDEFKNAMPDTQSIMLAQTVQRDAANQGVSAEVAKSVRDARVAEKEKQVVANGTTEKLTAAQNKLDAANRVLAQAKEDLKARRETVAVKTDAVIAATNELNANPTDDNRNAHVQALNELQKARIEEEQYEQHLEKATTDQQDASVELKSIKEIAMTDVRQQAEQMVAEEDQQRAEVAAQQEEQARIDAEQAEQARIDEEENNNFARAQADEIIAENYANATEEQKDKIRGIVKDIRSTKQMSASDKILERQDYVKRIGKKFGYDIRIGDTTEGGRFLFQNASVNPETGVITLSKEATLSDAMYAILGHEVTHIAEKSGLYNELADALLKLRYGDNTEQMNTDIDARLKLYTEGLTLLRKQGKNVDPSKVNTEYAKQELVADLMGNLFLDENGNANVEMLNRFAAESPNVATRVLNAIKNFLKKLVGIEGAPITETQRIVDTLEAALKEVNGKKATAEEKYNLGDFESITEDDEIRLLEMAQNGEFGNNTYIPVRRNTPQILIEEVNRHTGGEMVVENLPMISEVKHLRQDMDESSGSYNENEKPHDISPTEMIKIMKGMDDPRYIVYQSDNGRYAEVIKYRGDDNNHHASWAVVDFNSNKNTNVMNGYPGGGYNVLVTTFEPESLNNYLNKEGFEIIYDKAKDAVSRGYDRQWSSRTQTAPFAEIVNQPEKTVKPLVEDANGDELAVELPGGTISIDPTVRFSLSSFDEDEQKKVREALYNAKDANGKKRYTKKQVDQYLKDAQGVAAMIAADKTRLDFEVSDPNKSMVKSNSDYGASIDASTLCAKRLVYQGTFDAIQHLLPNTPLLPSDLIHLSDMMREMGYETPCGICYVESRRRNLDSYIAEWLKDYNGEYIPSIDEVSTTDGLEKIRKEHKQTYDDFMAAMNSHGKQNNPKPVQLRTEYKGEIRNLSDKLREKFINHGGIRLQSFSDFETPHLLDMMQVVMDIASKNLTSQAYTKVPNFAWAFGDTGIKINLSLIGKGEGVDADGNLIFDDVEGMPFEEAMKLRNRYSKNVGTILVGINDRQILAAMADPRIDYIIPFHSSGWTKEDMRLMPTLEKYTDYQNYQTEKDVDTGAKTKKNGGNNIAPVGEKDDYGNGYWNFKKTGKQNAEKYLDLCYKNGLIPVFSQFLDKDEKGHYRLKKDGSTDGYWKLLIDFKMYDNDGKGSPQLPVTPNVNMAEADRILREYKLEREQPGAKTGKGTAPAVMKDNNSLPVAQPVVDRFVEEMSERGKRDTEEWNAKMAAMGRSQRFSLPSPEVEEAAEKAFPDTKARTSDGKLMPLYHGTSADFNEFDTSISGGKNGVQEGYGIYLTDNEEIPKQYGGRIISAYVDMKRPAYADKKTFKRSELAKVIKASCEKEAQQFVDEGSYDNVKEAVRDTWISNYIYTPDYRSIEDAYKATADAILEQNDNDSDIISELLIGQGIRDYGRAMDFYHNILTPLTGFDGIWAKWTNRDTGEKSNILLAFDSSQIKSNEPVTYDDQGNPIPMDQRFDRSSQDIRYSLPSDTELDQFFDEYIENMSAEELDQLSQELFGIPLSSSSEAEASEPVDSATESDEIAANAIEYYKEAVNNGDMDAARNIVGKIAKAAGYTVYGTHRTNAKFNVFEKSKQSGERGKALGDGFYIASGEGTEYDNDAYGKNRMLVYVNPGNTFDIQKNGFTKKQAREVYDKYFAPKHPNATGDNPYTAHVIAQLQNPYKVIDYIKEAAENANTTTDEVFKWLGYDSVKDGPQYAVFDSSQIKLADPVTYDDDGNPISAEERFNGQSPDIRYSLPSDAPYLSAVNHGDMEEAQRIIDEKAKEAGYTQKVFHGTPRFGFTEFDLDLGQGTIFVAYDEGVSKTYSDDSYVREIGKGPKDYYNLLPDELVNELKKDQKATFDSAPIMNVEYKSQEQIREQVDDAIGKAINALEGLHWAAAATTKETLVKMASENTGIEGSKLEACDSLKEMAELLAEQVQTSDNTATIGKDALVFILRAGARANLEGDVAKEVFDVLHKFDMYSSYAYSSLYDDGGIYVENINGESGLWRPSTAANVLDHDNRQGIYQLYARPGKQLVVDANGSTWSSIPWNAVLGDPSDDNEELWDDFENNYYTGKKTANTRTIASWAKDHDYNSVRINNVYDSGSWGSDGFGDIGVFFDSKDLKSADTVTYDADGNEIPPSERFNTKQPDIRYSLPSDEILDEQIRGYLAEQDRMQELPAGEEIDLSTDTGIGPQRQFGHQTAQESNALDQEVKDYLYTHSSYTPDSNQEQIDRSVAWVQSLATTSDPEGYHAAVNEVTSPNFDYRSADGQARMLTVMSMAALKGDIDTELRLADAYNKQGTDLGRQLQARKIFRLMTPIGRQSVLQGMADDINEEYGRKGITTRVALSDWTMLAAEAADTEEDFAKVRKAAAKELAEQMPENWRDKLRGWRMLSMLGNPRTHIRNVIGNAMFIPAVSLKNKLGAVGEIISGQETRTKTLSPVVSKSIREFAKQDAVAMKDTLTGEAKYNEDNLVEKERKTFKGMLQALSDFNSNMLEKEDWVFLKGHYIRALGGWMQANGYTAEQLQANPALLQQGRTYAIGEAQKATYRDFNKLAQTLNQVSRQGGVAGFIVDAALPFKKTPANILRRGLEYSPVGIARSLTTDAYHLKQYMDYQNGKLDVLPEKAISPNQFIDKLCSGLTGTAILAVGAILSNLGVVSCGLDDDDDKFEKARGGQEYAIRFNLFGQDVTFTVDWAAPMSMPFFVGAAIQEQFANQGEVDVDSLVNAIGAITEPVFNLSMLDGVNSLFKTSQYDDTNTLTQIGAKILSNYATSYVPSALGAIARTVDDTRRKSFVESGKGTGVMGTFRYAKEQVENKIPGLSQTNIPYRDVWGNPETSGIVERILENFVLPGYIQEYKSDPVVDELQRLYNETGVSSMIPSDPDKTITYNGEKHVLSDKEWDAYKVSRGQTAYNTLTSLMSNPNYLNSDPDEQAQLVKDVWDYATQTGKKTVFPNFKMDDYGADPVQTITESEKQKKKNKQVTANKNEMIKALDAGDYEAYETMVEALREDGVTDQSIKDKIADTYRDQYKDAYRNEDYIRMLEIEELLDNTGFSFNTASWEKAVDKED